MDFLDAPSAKSLWRGWDYHKEGMVVSSAKLDDGTFEGEVRGSDGARYRAHIDVEHPRRSTCTCPFADGRRVVCKHQVALYFATHPARAATFLDEMEQKRREAELEYERWRAEEEAEIRRSVNRMSAKEAKALLADYLIAERFERDDRYW